MEDQDIRRLTPQQLEGLHRAAAQANKMKEMCKTEGWKDLERRTEELIFDKRKKWLSPKLSDDAAKIVRIKAMALKEFLDLVKQDLVKGINAEHMISRHNEINSGPQK